MARAGGIAALIGAGAGLAAGAVAQRAAINRRRKRDPYADEPYGRRRGDRSRRIELPDGARLFVEEVGPSSAAGAVFVHGSALRTDVWHHQMAGIGGHRLVFYDLRGHGLSQPKGDAPFSIRTLADDLRAVIEACRLEEVVVVGHSIGGMIALQLARGRPDMLGSPIKGLVLCNTTHRPAAETILGGAAISRLERATRRPLDVLGSQSRHLEVLRKVIRPSDGVFWAVSLAAFGPDASSKQVDFAYDMLAETPADVIFDLIRSYRDFEVGDALGEITVPALVVCGSDDRLTVADASRHIARRLPKAELKMLQGCGHMTMLERHRDLNAMLSSFFDDVLEKGMGETT